MRDSLVKKIDKRDKSFLRKSDSFQESTRGKAWEQNTKQLATVVDNLDLAIESMKLFEKNLPNEGIYQKKNS